MDEVHAVHGVREWHRPGTGAGSKGERWYDWQCWLLAEPEDADWGHYLLFRRSYTDTEDWQAYAVFAPQDYNPETLAAAGTSSTLSRPPSRRWGWTTTRCAARTAGTGTRRGPCEPWPCWQSCRQPSWTGRTSKKSPETPGLAAFKRSRGLAAG